MSKNLQINSNLTCFLHFFFFQDCDQNEELNKLPLLSCHRAPNNWYGTILSKIQFSSLNKHLTFFYLSLITCFLGAEEVIYAQVGDTVTLNIQNPPGNNFYIHWYFENNKFAWFTHVGGQNPNLGERSVDKVKTIICL